MSHCGTHAARSGLREKEIPLVVTTFSQQHRQHFLLCLCVLLATTFDGKEWGKGPPKNDFEEPDTQQKLRETVRLWHHCCHSVTADGGGGGGRRHILPDQCTHTGAPFSLSGDSHSPGRHLLQVILCFAQVFLFLFLCLCHTSSAGCCCCCYALLQWTRSINFWPDHRLHHHLFIDQALLIAAAAVPRQ